MPRFLHLTSGHREADPKRLVAAARDLAAIDCLDLYGLDDIALGDYAAILLSMHVDQRYVSARAGRLDAYLREGGTVVANGHHAYPFLPGLSLFRPVPDARLSDLIIHRERDHPVWEGVDAGELTFRRGVAGFYGRGWHEPPHGATVVHTIGEDRGPVDVVYGVGRGRVLFHGGNDLWHSAGAGDTTARIVPQLLAWLVAGRQAG